MNTGMGRRGAAWKTPTVTADGLKIFACVVMLIQNIGIAIVENGLIKLDQYTQESLSMAMETNSDLMFLAGAGSIMQLIGGMAVPVFAFLLVEGFLKTSDYRKYLLSMAVFAVISEVPYDLAMNQRLIDHSGQNALFSMTISLLMLYFLKMMKKKKGAVYAAAQVLIVICAVIWASLFRAQYGLCIVLLAAIFYLFYTKHVLKTVLGIIVSLLYVTGPISFYGIWCYNEERKNILPKYAYYVFYPLHLLVLGLIVKLFMA
ncbi:MAG: TraX family protein [Eubacteriales bacterium]|nr:TraX family protein [Eubacteriales bacterium]